MKVYVAGPYSGGDTVLNVRNAIDAADKLLRAGHVPFVPHLTMFWHLVHPHTYEVWLEYDRVWLLECDALLRLSGKSDGADQEVQDAIDNRIPIYYGDIGLNELVQFDKVVK